VEVWCDGVLALLLPADAVEMEGQDGLANIVCDSSDTPRECEKSKPQHTLCTTTHTVYTTHIHDMTCTVRLEVEQTLSASKVPTSLSTKLNTAVSCQQSSPTAKPSIPYTVSQSAGPAAILVRTIHSSVRPLCYVALLYKPSSV